MAERHLRHLLTSFVVRKMQIKMALRNLFAIHGFPRIKYFILFSKLNLAYKINHRYLLATEISAFKITRILLFSFLASEIINYRIILVLVWSFFFLLLLYVVCISISWELIRNWRQMLWIYILLSNLVVTYQMGHMFTMWILW